VTGRGSRGGGGAGRSVCVAWEVLGTFGWGACEVGGGMLLGVVHHELPLLFHDWSHGSYRAKNGSYKTKKQKKNTEKLNKLKIKKPYIKVVWD